MKKKTLKSIVLTAAMVMVLSVSACGSKEADTPTEASTAEETTVTATEAESQTETEAETETEPAAEAGDYKTVEDYYNDPEVKAILDQQMEAAAGQGMSISIEVKENDFTMIYQYDPDITLPDDVKDQLETALESNASVFEAQAQSFDEVIGADGASAVTVRYLDSDGGLILEKSYKAQ
ncbi:MAG: DUF4854 domain-containing protein [Hungatella sp.]|nr:DUF4854 domain-containing protein [Hungatella sp.]